MLPLFNSAYPVKTKPSALMMKPIKLSALLLLFNFSHIVNADEWILSNGDVIHGDLIEKGADHITIQHLVLGKLILASSQIKQATAPPSRSLKTDQGLFKTAFLTDWEKTVEIGLKGSEGNSRNRHLHVGTRLKFKNNQKRWDIEMAHDSSKNGGEQSRNEFFAQFNRDFLTASTTHFYFTEGRYNWDEFEDWDYRLSGASGLGYQLINKVNWTVNSRVGIGISKEFSSEDAQWIPEGRLGIESNWNIAKQHSLEFKTTFYPSLKDAGEFLNISVLNWKTELDQLSGVGFKVGLKNEFDSKSSNENRKNDFKYHLSLVLEI